MELQVIKSNGNKASKIKIDASVFDVKPNRDAVHRAILSEMTNSRQGTHGSKSREWCVAEEKNLGNKKAEV